MIIKLLISKKQYFVAYRFGYNKGSEKDDEIYGLGNTYTTHFRELDTRIGRWWAIDPEEHNQEDYSPYSAMNNDPISKNDEDGDIWNYVLGGLAGGIADYATQVTTNMLEGKKNAFSDINWASVGASTLEGVATSGASVIKNTTTKIIVKSSAKVLSAAAKNTVEVKYSNNGFKVKTEKKASNIIKNTVIDITVDATVSNILPSSKTIQKGLSKTGINKGVIANNTKKIVKATGTDITRKTNETIKKASSSAIKHTSNGVHNTSKTYVNAKINKSVNDYKKRTDR